MHCLANTFSAITVILISSSEYGARARQQYVLMKQYEHVSALQYNIALAIWAQALPSMHIVWTIPIKNAATIWYF